MHRHHTETVTAVFGEGLPQLRVRLGRAFGLGFLVGIMVGFVLRSLQDEGSNGVQVARIDGSFSKWFRLRVRALIQRISPSKIQSP